MYLEDFGRLGLHTFPVHSSILGEVRCCQTINPNCNGGENPKRFATFPSHSLRKHQAGFYLRVSHTEAGRLDWISRMGLFSLEVLDFSCWFMVTIIFWWGLSSSRFGTFPHFFTGSGRLPGCYYCWFLDGGGGNGWGWKLNRLSSRNT